MTCTLTKAFYSPVALLGAALCLPSCSNGDEDYPEDCKVELEPSANSLVGEWVGDFEMAFFAEEDAAVAADGCEGSIDLVLEETEDDLSGSGTCDCQPSDFYPGILESEWTCLVEVSSYGPVGDCSTSGDEAANLAVLRMELVDPESGSGLVWDSWITFSSEHTIALHETAKVEASSGSETAVWMELTRLQLSRE